jgi:hypothetical protein
MAEGYFKAFFQEETRLGMGANGSVFLCQVRRTLSLTGCISNDSQMMIDGQHVLNGNHLGKLSPGQP